MALVIEVLCEGNTHRLEVRDDGTFHMLDHEEIDVRAFVAFGAKPPGCLEAIDEARDNQVDFLVQRIVLDQKTRALLACDFAEHVLPIWYEYYPDDHRPKKAIEAARKYVAGKINESALKIAGEAAWAAANAASSAWAASAGASAAWLATRAASAVWWAARVSAASEARAASWLAAYYHAEAHGNDPAAARAAEKKWQAGRMVQVVEAISRGEDPWHS